MDTIKYLNNMHHWFIKETDSFINIWSFKNIIYYPIAYYKFMTTMFKHYILMKYYG